MRVTLIGGVVSEDFVGLFVGLFVSEVGLSVPLCDGDAEGLGVGGTVLKMGFLVGLDVIG
jgi:hypothetical protein